MVKDDNVILLEICTYSTDLANIKGLAKILAIGNVQL